MSLFDTKGADPDYNHIGTSPTLSQERAFLEDIFGEYYPTFADRDFSKKIADDFHPFFWEMYLTCTLIRNGHRATPRYEQGGKRDERPDVCLTVDGSKVWIEAQAPTQGKGNNTVPLPREDAEEFDQVPSEKIMLRYTHSLYTKLEGAYNKYVDGGIVGKDESYIVAINGGNIPFFHSNMVDLEVPLIVQATLGVGEDTVIYDPLKDQIVRRGVLHRDTLEKQKCDGEREPISTFLSDQENYGGISGVLFSWVDAYWASSYQGREFIYVHNGSAENPVPKGWLKFGREYWREDSNLYWSASDHIRRMRVLRA